MKLLDYLYETLRGWPSGWVWVVLLYVLFDLAFDAAIGLKVAIEWLP